MFRIIFYLVVIFHLSSTSKQNDLTEANDIDFSKPDLSVDYTLNGETIRLDAYKSENNDKIISSGDSSLFSQLRWVSIGRPKLIQLTNSSDLKQHSLFQFENEKFSIHFNLLTHKEKKILQQEIKRTKRIEVDVNSFLNLKPTSVSCSVKFFDKTSEKFFILNVKVDDLISFPLEVNFKYIINSPERIAFQKRILEDSSLDFFCTITGGSTSEEEDVFTITLKQINDMNLNEKLFGRLYEVYITQNQLSELANEVNSFLNVIEDYKMSAIQFNTDFVQNLIGIAGNGAFNPVSLRNGLKMLSRYTFKFDQDLKLDEITSELSNLFKIEQLINNSRIIFDQEYYNELSDKQSVNIFEICGGLALASFVQTKLDKDKSLCEQLKELNSYSKNQIHYEFQGSKLVPKSIRLAKLQSLSFKNNLAFSRIKNVYLKADYLKKIILSTKKSDLFSFSEYRLPEYSILMVGSDVINKHFDSTGKGFGRMFDWYLCNGQNDAPDLRGRFIVGKNEKNSDYNAIGKTGGLDKVVLSEDQMPKHTHIDRGHSHQIDLETNSSGNHYHRYDSYYRIWKTASDYAYYKNDLHYMWMTSSWTYSSGDHIHSIKGYSQSSRANLEQVGKNMEFENRPAYYVAQYIIYMPESA